MRAQGQRCVLVSTAESYARLSDESFQVRPADVADMQRLFRDALPSDQPTCRGIVHLYSLDTEIDETTASAVEAAQVRGCGSVVSLIQASATVRWREFPRLWLVTCGGQSVEARRVATLQAPLWGLGRTVAQEHSELWGGLVDLDPSASFDESTAGLWEDMARPDGEDEIVYRGGQRYVARLTRTRLSPETVRPPLWRPDGSYLITGGFGDLGLVIARWMVNRGARRLILLGRTSVPPRSKWPDAEPGSRIADQIAAVQELEAMGASVHLVALDVANETTLRSFLDSYRNDGWPPIRGVVHAAGVAQLHTLAEMDSVALDAVLRPKVLGGWLLDRLLVDQPLDFFVLFSSFAALLSSPRLGHYAAANAFLDALAHDRRALGKPALSINWGFWGDVGMAARALQSGRQLIPGLGSFSAQEALDLMDQLLLRDSVQVGVIRVNWPEWRRLHPTFSESPLLTCLTSGDADDAAEAGGPRRTDGEIQRTLLASDPAEQRRVLEEYVREQVSRSLGIAASALDVREPLNNVGIDSLTAVELKKQLEDDLGVAIPVVVLLEGPSVAQLSIRILEQFSAKDADPQRALIAPAADTEHALPDVDQLSDEQVDAMLGTLLAEDGSRGGAEKGHGHQE